ncbi:esterase-like activity of phytase family protein [Sphingomonas radiodurans]|uniref:esterase-like activity of phytase family protein n=1 Tax=Sphingomonas radiodurans TaxID=2890321 RepID=UPI001E556543|nr:esterase-like activity of phytase family protein [Sphingomonas radiodurans]WBH17897.1 esterase-like activity of phytase family protein [Sphingomonas radiodurans]
MRWFLSIPLSTLAVLLIVPRWSGDERLPLIAPAPTISAKSYVPKGGWPKRIGALEPIGALTLSSDDPAWGGFSAIALDRGHATLLSDGGNLVRFAINGGRIGAAQGFVLHDGPGVGWERWDRDSESLALDPARGTAWVGYENYNQIWRYAPAFARAEGRASPRAMRSWTRNQGAESLVRLRDGRFIAIAERRPNRRTRHAVIFSGDPTRPGTRTTRFRVIPPDRYDPSDAAELPNGDLLVLTRRFQYPFTFSAKLLRIPRAAIRAGAEARGTVIATLAPPIIGENCEGIAITRENGATMIWIVTDNDLMSWRPTYLMKFRLR